MAPRNVIPLFAMLMVIAGCRTMPPLQTVESVDIGRFMGDWYVIAHIPTFIEKEAYNAVESYALNPDGTVKTTFTYNKGGFDGPLKVYRAKGFIREHPSNAVWGMQFIWPFKAEYKIILLDGDYTQTVSGRTRRDYVWIMARMPSMPDDEYEKIVAFIESKGYDAGKLRKVPHG